MPKVSAFTRRICEILGARLLKAASINDELDGAEDWGNGDGGWWGTRGLGRRVGLRRQRRRAPTDQTRRPRRESCVCGLKACVGAAVGLGSEGMAALCGDDEGHWGALAGWFSPFQSFSTGFSTVWLSSAYRSLPNAFPNANSREEAL